MKEVLVLAHPDILTAEIREVPIPAPAHDEVVVKVVVAGSNVKGNKQFGPRSLF